MHASELNRATYTPPAESTDAETGGPASFMDLPITKENLASGELVRRFDPMAFPQVGVAYTGTDADGHAVPAPARAVTG